ncbi:hypothetical protein J3366_20565 [Tritonibacter mobilis]
MPPPIGRRGRQYRFSDAAIQTRSVLKVRPVCHCGK